MEFYTRGRELDGRHTLMDGRVPAERPAGGAVARLAGRLLGRRRTWLVDPSYQVRSALIAVLGMAFLLVFASALFHLLSLESARLTAGQEPRPGPGAAPIEMHSVLYLVAVGLFFVGAVFAIEIVETHKTAGVVHKVMRGLRDLERGRWSARLMLRRNDNFKEMEEAFNAATRALCEECDSDLRGLQGIEGQVRLIGREFESGNREGALVLLRQVAGELQSLRERKRNLLDAAPGAPPGQKAS